MYTFNDLSEFDESREIVQNLVDEYKACESADYIKWGMEVHTWISFTYIIVHVKLLMRFLLFLFLLAMEKCEVMCLIDFLIVFCMQDKASRCLVMGILVELLTKECHNHRETNI